MKKLFAAMLALSTLTALTSSVEAQLTTGRQRQKSMLQVEDEQKKKAAEKAEQEYEATMRKAQGQGGDQTAVDPWANMRAVDGAQPKH
ncbi:MAG TPA: hypothetical protein VFW22_10990 [Pseudolabrys sp.]|nr:hypothetical protein [Pseudolabrys sp.]